MDDFADGDPKGEAAGLAGFQSWLDAYADRVGVPRRPAEQWDGSVTAGYAAEYQAAVQAWGVARDDLGAVAQAEELVRGLPEQTRLAETVGPEGVARLRAAMERVVRAKCGHAYDRALFGWLDDIDKAHAILSTLRQWGGASGDTSAQEPTYRLLRHLSDAWVQIMDERHGIAREALTGLMTDRPEEAREAIAVTVARLPYRAPELLDLWREVTFSVFADFRRAPKPQ